MKNNTVMPTHPLELSAWLFLQWYYLPFRMPELMGETEKWVSSVSLNGSRWSNLCKPN